MDNLVFIRGIAFIFSGTLFWFVYFNIKDSYKPEPRRLLLRTFVLGVLSGGLALGIYRILDWFGISTDNVFELSESLLRCILLIGLVEEGIKFMVARLVVFRWKSFDEFIDGMVYASALAIGFAALENFIYMPYLSWPLQLTRTLSSPLTHSLWAIIWGFGISRAFFSTNNRVKGFFWQSGTLLLSAVLHGLYDFLLFSYEKTYLASGIVLIVWMFLIVRVSRLKRIKTNKSLKV